MKVKDNNLLTYLKEKGVLETGSESEILAEKNLYLRNYKREWRKQKRKAEKEFVIYFGKQELSLLNKEAKKHNLSRTKFIKSCFYGYINKTYIVPDILEIRRLSQALQMIYSQVENQYYDQKLDPNIGVSILKELQRIENSFLPLLHHPKDIYLTLREHLNKGEKNIDEVLKVIYDFKKSNKEE